LDADVGQLRMPIHTPADPKISSLAPAGIGGWVLGKGEGVIRMEGKVALMAMGMGTDEFPAGNFR